jgi:hypothetical protein
MPQPQNEIGFGGSHNPNPSYTVHHNPPLFPGAFPYPAMPLPGQLPWQPTTQGQGHIVQPQLPYSFPIHRQDSGTHNFLNNFNNSTTQSENTASKYQQNYNIPPIHGTQAASPEINRDDGDVKPSNLTGYPPEQEKSFF